MMGRRGWTNYGCGMPTSARPHPLRWVLSGILALAAVLLAALTVALAWFGATVVDSNNFVDKAGAVAQEENFRDQLTDHVTDDIMASEAVTHYLGDGSQGGILSGAKNALRDTAKRVIRSAVDATVNSSDFQSVWKDTASATHDANFGPSPSSTLVLDASPFYSEINDRVHGLVHVNLGLDQGDHRIALESAPAGQTEGPTAEVLHRGQTLSAMTPVLGTATAIAALAAAVIAPRGKLLMVALISAAAALVTWVGMSVLGSRFNAAMGSVGDTGGLIAQHLGKALTSNIQAWTLTSLGVGLGLAVILVIVHVLGGSRGENRHVF